MTLPESKYRDLFALQYRGKCEVRVPLGRVDVVTDTHAVEVEPFGSWRHGARQALAYAAQLRITPALAVYGHLDDYDRETVWVKLHRLMDVFVLTRTRWVQLTSQSMAARGQSIVSDDAAILHAIEELTPPPSPHPALRLFPPYRTPEARWSAQVQMAAAMDALLTDPV